MCKRNDQCRLFCALWGWQSTCSSVQGLHPFVSVGTFNFGFVWAEALQAAVCWRFPPTHSSGSPEHSSADMAARPQSLCSAQSAQPWNWIQSCISTFIKINKLKRTPVTHDYKSTMTSGNLQCSSPKSHLRALVKNRLYKIWKSPTIKS